MSGRWIILLFFFNAFLNSLTVAQQSPAPSAGNWVVVDSGFVFSNPPFTSCHASTLVELGDGRLMAAWFAGTAEGKADVAIWSSVYTGHRWSEPLVLARGLDSQGQPSPCWNPALFRTSAGRLFVFYKVGPSPREWWGEFKSSTNDGFSWSEPARLPAGFLGPVRNKPLQLESGELLCPSSTEEMNGNWQIHLERCDSLGRNWQRINVACDTLGVIQPALLTYPDGSLQLLCRSRHNRIAESWSYDNGHTWQPLRLTSLANPNSAIDALSLGKSGQLIVYNPLPAGKDWWLGRSVLKLAASFNGRDWTDLATLENHDTGEYSYPAIISTSGGLVFISYTWQRKNIRFWAGRYDPPYHGHK